MNENIIAIAARLSDEALLARLQSLALRGRETCAELIAHLAELVGRRSHLGEGPGSLYGYCREVLKLSEHAAYHRIEAAHVARAFPVVLDLLASGSVNLTNVALLRPVLTPGNHLALLGEASGRTKDEVKEIVARLRPRPDVPSSVRRLPAPVTAGSVSTAPSSTAAPLVLTVLPKPLLPGAVGRHIDRPADRPVVAPLAPERYRVQFTIGKDTQQKLRRLQDLMRREIPDGDPAAIFDRAITLLLADVERRKLGATSKPSPARPIAPGSRTIPAHVRRAVVRRDGRRCAFKARDGRRCSESSFLEFHHVQAHALGGPPTVENIALRCRAHNAYEGEVVFGRRTTRPANSVWTELTGGLPDFARTPFSACYTADSLRP